MNTQLYDKMSIEVLENLIDSKYKELEEVKQEIDNFEEDYVGELIHEKREIESEINKLNKILKDKESRC